MPLKILVAPLDWGLGHATRCFPIIDWLRHQGHSVTLAAPENILKFSTEIFPEINRLPLPGYQIQYSHNRAFFLTKIVAQVPKILKIINQENQWLKKTQEEEQFDFIISDNRYGLHHVKVPSIIMTHQLSIRSGKGGFLDKKIRKWHYHFLEQFDACWIVDNEGNHNLAGQLSHPHQLPKNGRYIGLLSQMTLQSFSKVKITPSNQKIILILLSGPEPMRSMLEEKLWQQAVALSDKYCFYFVGGNIKETKIEGKSNPHIKYYKNLPLSEIKPLIQKCLLVVCRSGYSTLMDMAYLNKRMLLIPTPGQTEQEYLSHYLNETYGIPFSYQKKVNLKIDIPKGLVSKPSKLPIPSLELLSQSFNLLNS